MCVVDPPWALVGRALVGLYASIYRWLSMGPQALVGRALVAYICMCIYVS